MPAPSPVRGPGLRPQRCLVRSARWAPWWFPAHSPGIPTAQRFARRSARRPGRSSEVRRPARSSVGHSLGTGLARPVARNFARAAAHSSVHSVARSPGVRRPARSLGWCWGRKGPTPLREHSLTPQTVRSQRPPTGHNPGSGPERRLAQSTAVRSGRSPARPAGHSPEVPGRSPEVGHNRRRLLVCPDRSSGEPGRNRAARSLAWPAAHSSVHSVAHSPGSRRPARSRVVHSLGECWGRKGPTPPREHSPTPQTARSQRPPTGRSQMLQTADSWKKPRSGRNQSWAPTAWGPGLQKLRIAGKPPTPSSRHKQSKRH